MRRVALLAGGGGTLGPHITQALQARGWRVIAVGRQRARLQAELEASGVFIENLDLHEADLSDPAQVATLAATCPAPDAVLHLAGRLDLGLLEETSPEVFTESWRVNTLGPFLIARAFSPGMLSRGHGHLMFFGATTSRRGSPRTPAFAAAKHGLRGLAEALAKDLGPRGVHVTHLIIDGKVAGGRTQARFPEANPAQCLQPQDVAHSVVALLEQPPSARTFELDLRPAGERW